MLLLGQLEICLETDEELLCDPSLQEEEGVLSIHLHSIELCKQVVHDLGCCLRMQIKERVSIQMSFPLCKVHMPHIHSTRPDMLCVRERERRRVPFELGQFQEDNGAGLRRPPQL